jgi:hypothetical protein
LPDGRDCFQLAPLVIRYSYLENDVLVLDKVTGKHQWKVFSTATSGSMPITDDRNVLRDETDVHLASIQPELRDAYLSLRKVMHSFGDVKEKVLKIGITYYFLQAIGRFEFRKNHIDLLLKAGAVNADTENRLKDITSYEWGFPYLFKIIGSDDVEYAERLIRATYLAAQ